VVSLELAVVATLDLSQQYGIFVRLNLSVVFGEVGFLVDCSCSLVVDGWVLDVAAAAAMISTGISFSMHFGA